MIYNIFEARFEDCQTCTRKPECCPDNRLHGRSVAQLEGSFLVAEFRKKMASEEAEIPSPGKNRGILSRVDQEQAGAAAISCERPGKGANGNALGFSHRQPATVDPPKQAPVYTSSHMRE